MLFGETKDTGILALTVNALYNSIGEHRAMKYVRRIILNSIEIFFFH